MLSHLASVLAPPLSKDKLSPSSLEPCLSGAQAPVCWGIMGTARIANTVLAAMQDAPSAVCTAIASRSEQKAKEWGTERGIEKAYGSYEQLLADEEIDAVYIPLPTSLHVEWVVKAAQAKKHVLVEKPAAVTTAELETMVSACSENNVQFMDGVMFMHNARLPKLQAAASSEIGSVRRIISSFTFAGSPSFFRDDIRVRNDGTGDPLGCLGDLGWYNVRVTLCMMNYQLPDWVSAHAISNDAGVSLGLTATLFYEKHACLCSFDCGFETTGRNWLEISGTDGRITLDGFTSSRDEHNSFEITQSAPNAGARRVDTPLVITQQAQMIENMCDIAKTGHLNPTFAKIAVDTQRVIDALQQSWQENGKRQLL
jgi:predicted dehydrogenase